MYQNELELYNFREFNDEKGLFCRFPNQLRLNLNNIAQSNAFLAVGCEIRFQMKSNSVKVHLKASKGSEIPNAAAITVFFGSFQYQREFYIDLEAKEEIDFTIEKPEYFDRLERMTVQGKLPYDPNLVRIVLPYGLKLSRVTVEGDILRPAKGQYPEDKFMIYGSSISSGASAIEASSTYAHRCSQILSMDLLNLGLSGSAFLEKEMADHIADIEFTVGLLELGINVFEDWSAEEFLEKARYFIQKIATAHKEDWVFVIDIFPYCYDFEPEHPNNVKLKQYRDGVRKIIEILNLPKLYYIPVSSVFESLAGLTIDRLHPSNTGHESIARYLSKEIKKVIG